MSKFVLLWRWWWVGCAFLWLLCWKVQLAHGFMPVAVQLKALAFQIAAIGRPDIVGREEFVAVEVGSGWRTAPARATSLLSTTPDLLNRELPFCHTAADLSRRYGASTCGASYQEATDLRYFWSTESTEYLWRIETGELVLWSPEVPEDRPTERGHLYITEVNWAGSYLGESSNSNDEWIELYNPTGTPWSLQGVTLTNVRRSHGSYTFSANAWIPAYGYVVLARVKGQSTTLLYPANVYDTSLSLSNTEAGIQLFSATGELLDQTPSGEWQAGLNDTTGLKRASAQRDMNQLSEELSEGWSSWGTCTDAARCILPSEWQTVTGEQNLATPWQASLY